MRNFRADILVSLVLAGAALVLFAPACAGDFTNYDDPDYVTQNPHVRTGLRLANVGWAFSATHSANWHPLTWLQRHLDPLPPPQESLHGTLGPPPYWQQPRPGALRPGSASQAPDRH